MSETTTTPVATARDVNRWTVALIQITSVGAFLLVWQFAPEISAVRDLMPFMDRFFISSPVDVADRLLDMVLGRTQPNVWRLLGTSARGIVIGGALGLAVGTFGGLIVSHSPTMNEIVSPFLTALNATPRLALVPIFVVVFGPTQTASIVVCAFVVFLRTLFSAIAGGRSVPDSVMLNAYLLGAGQLGLLRIRWKYVTVWVFAVLPSVLSTAFIAGLLTEILSASAGLGRLVRQSLERLDATTTMALVVFLSVIGASLSRAGRMAARWRLHWFPGAKAL